MFRYCRVGYVRSLVLTQVKTNGVSFLRSHSLESIGVPHGFSTRVGGVSTGPFSSMNLGQASMSNHQDEPENIAENWRRFQSAIGLANYDRASVAQVHGSEIVEVGESMPGADVCGDAVITVRAKKMLSIQVADCAAVLLASEDGKEVAAVHAGWRGAVQEIVRKAISRMKASPQCIIAAIGPCIGPDAFEVGEEVAVEFDRVNLSKFVRRSATEKCRIDLSGSIEKQLRRAGVVRIDSTDVCTFGQERFFFSHRRDRGTTGRMAACIATRD